MSNFNIKSINGLAPEQGKSYFFDANVWIRLLLPTVQKTSAQDEYTRFFEATFALGANTVAKKPPRIIITNILVSEIFNRYSRIKSKLMKDSSSYQSYSDSKFYKDIYRRSSNFINDVEEFKENFLAYEEVMITVSSEYCCNPIEAVNNLTHQMDYNDYLYYQICLKSGFALVTHDGDFYVPDIEVITEHYNLLKRRS